MTDRLVVEVARDVFVLTSSLYDTTSTIVRRGDSALLVDPAWTPDELDDIAHWLADNGCAVTCGFATHAHTPTGFVLLKPSIIYQVKATENGVFKILVSF